MKKLLIVVFLVITLAGCFGKKKTAPAIMDFTLDGHSYTLPSNVKEFTDDGWIYCDLFENEEDIYLEKEQYVGVAYCKENIEITLILTNSSSEVATVNNATVSGIAFYPRNYKNNISDDYFTLKGLNLVSSIEKVEEAWKDYPNFESEGNLELFYRISYYIPSEEFDQRYDGEMMILYYNQALEVIEINSSDYRHYTLFVSPTLLQKYTDIDKEWSKNISDDYDAVLMDDYVYGYFKGFVVEETTIHYDYGSYHGELVGYVIEDNQGQKIVIYMSYIDDFTLEVGQEYEFWGWTLSDYYIQKDVPIITLEIHYIDKDGVEIFNFLRLEY